MASKRSQNNANLAYSAGVLAWLVPGAGHWCLGRRPQALIIFVTICATFALGIHLAGIEMVDPHGSTAWFCAQMLAGVPALVAVLLQNPDVPAEFGRGVDLGQVYAGVAGLLNLLCVLDALMKTHQAAPKKPTPKPQ